MDGTQHQRLSVGTYLVILGGKCHRVDAGDLVNQRSFVEPAMAEILSDLGHSAGPTYLDFLVHIASSSFQGAGDLL
jgi:hypothetical protein